MSVEKEKIVLQEEVHKKRPIAEQSVPGIEKVIEQLKEKGLDLVGERQPLSQGFAGPIYRLETEQGVSIVEKTFAISVSKTGLRKRFSVEKNVPVGSRREIRSRLGVVGHDGEVTSVVVDFLYNEEKALMDLEGIPGIPKMYGPVYDGLRGSILEQCVDGFDLSELTYNLEAHVSSSQEINDLFDKVRTCYEEAAARGYLYNEPWGSTIMVDKEARQPYLVDWYNHSSGDIVADGPVKEKFEQGLRDIEEYRKSVLEFFDELVTKKTKEAIQSAS